MPLTLNIFHHRSSPSFFGITNSDNTIFSGDVKISRLKRLYFEYTTKTFPILMIQHKKQFHNLLLIQQKIHFKFCTQIKRFSLLQFCLHFQQSLTLIFLMASNHEDRKHWIWRTFKRRKHPLTVIVIIVKNMKINVRRTLLDWRWWLEVSCDCGWWVSVTDQVSEGDE